MLCLLDTHVFLWSLLDPKKLSKRATEIIQNRENDIFVSTITYWEIAVKSRIHVFTLQGLSIKELPQQAAAMGFSSIALQEMETCSCGDLPFHEDHKDPFDKMLIWQAITRKMGLISKDSQFPRYKKDGLKILW